MHPEMPMNFMISITNICGEDFQKAATTMIGNHTKHLFFHQNEEKLGAEIGKK